jgi:hypothetical protein
MCARARLDMRCAHVRAVGHGTIIELDALEIGRFMFDKKRLPQYQK